MENPWLHRYAVLVAVCTALLVITGPVVTSNEARPLYSLGRSHAWLGAAVSALMAGLVVWLSRLKEPTWLLRLAWAALGVNIAEDLLGLDTGPVPAPIRIAHTLLGQLFSQRQWRLQSSPRRAGTKIPSRPRIVHYRGFW